ncbi:Protein FAM13A [Fasciola hepatica]|uniref:Protein FAM13A n=1 Tax=Fasciola hepatica TaxID=6192 RepID=A0A4E0R669_FASHE|nr:Protein FAM13A [Fasciola hepatica]
MLMARLVRKFSAEPNVRKACRTNPDRRSFRATFGVSLNEVINRDGTDIPLVVLDVFHFLLNCDALKCEGIFRVNGNSRTVEMLRSLIDETGPNWRISQFTHELQVPERSLDVYSVASLLKLYLRELPGGLVPTDVTNSLVEAYLQFRSDTTTLFYQITLLLGRLTAASYALLQHLCHFLNQVWMRRFENKMSSEALGIVFGPNVFSFGLDRATIQDQGAANRIMSILIERAGDFFHLNIDYFSLGVDGSATDSDKTKKKISGHASDIELEDHSSDYGSPSNSTVLEEKKYTPFIDSTCVLYDGEIGSSPFAMPYLNKLHREEFSSQISAAIRACIEEHIFGGLQSVPQKSAIDSDHLYGYPSSVEKFDVVVGPPASEYDYVSADELERDSHAASCVDVVSAGPDSDRTQQCPVEDYAGTSKMLSQLTRRLHLIRTALRDYERRFERERGRKPNTSEKKADHKIRSLMADLTEVRATIKQLQNRSEISERESMESSTQVIDAYDSKLQGDSNEPNSYQSPSNVLLSDPVETHSKARDLTILQSASLPVNSPTRSAKGDWSPAAAAAHELYTVEIEEVAGSENSLQNPKNTEDQSISFSGHQTKPSTTPVYSHHNSLPSPVLGTTVRKPEQTLSETLAVLTHRLSEKRCSAKRPECLQLMTRKQIEDEKLDLQKALLYFEALHGRPSGKQERLIMRPLYDRYRSVKRMLNQEYQLSRTSSASSEVLKGETKHIVSSEGDSGQTEKPLSSATSSYVRPLTMDDPKDTWDKESQSKFSTLPHAWIPTKDSKETIPSEIGKKKTIIHSDTKSDSVGSLPHLAVGHHRSEIELSGYVPGPPSTENRWALFENPSSGGDAESPDHAASDCVSTVKAIDCDIPDRVSTCRSTLRPFNKPWSAQVNVDINEHLKVTGPSATALSSFAAPDYRTHTTNAKLDKEPGVVGPSIGHANLEESNEDDPTKWSLSQLKCELNTIRESKRHLQKILKDFEHGFEQTMGHKVERADRSSMRNQYTRYKFLKSRLALLEDELRSRVN